MIQVFQRLESSLQVTLAQLRRGESVMRMNAKMKRIRDNADQLKREHDAGRLNEMQFIDHITKCLNQKA
jgi:hypothetical protein